MCAITFNSAFNSAFIVSAASFAFESDYQIYQLTCFLFSLASSISPVKLIIITNRIIFSLSVWYFGVIMCFWVVNFTYVFFNFIKSGSSSRASNARYFTLSISDLIIIICLFNDSTSVRCFLIFIIYFFSRPDLLVLYWVFKTNTVLSIALNLVTKWSYKNFLRTLLSTTLHRLLK